MTWGRWKNSERMEKLEAFIGVDEEGEGMELGVAGGLRSMQRG